MTSLTDRLKSEGRTIGFVPTMGALHNGHLSLVENSKLKNDITVVSIFVNPTQFNDKKDLQNYPRTLEEDLHILEKYGCDIVFTPSIEEMYPEKDKRVFDFGNIGAVMEGAKRPGHFNGVAQIVSKLFDTVKPHRAYFGQKDFQQIAIIREMIRQLNMAIEIVACDIVRESDGLAMSSRNKLLKPEQRKNVSHIYTTLKKAVKLKSKMSVEELKKWVIEEINSNPFLETDYFDIVNGYDLSSLSDWDGNSAIYGCIAVYTGEIRLIDNIRFS